MIARSDTHGVLTVEQAAPAYDGSESRFGLGSLKESVVRLSGTKLGSAALGFFTPEIFQRRRASGAHRASRPHTAWLDGLRGWAAFIVCFVHLSVYTHPHIELCYGHEISPGEYNNTPAAWPFLRILWSGGHFSVVVFFTISGYVLTQKLTMQLDEGRRDDFLGSVNSAIFRRPIRLFMPVVLSTMTFLLVWHVFGVVTPWPPRQPTLFLELVAWVNETLGFFYFFKTGFLFTVYNIHTWTIPVELRGSLFVFVWLFALHQIANRLRIVMTLVMTLYLAFFTPGAWYACFFAGSLTAELHSLAAAGKANGGIPPISLPWDGLFRALHARERLAQVIYHLMFVCALYFASEPTADMFKDELLGKCTGWVTLGKLIPPAYYDRNTASLQRWFWLFWGSWMILVSAREIGWIRRWFETDFSQYLGRISFALYLCHGPMIGILSERLFYLTGVKTPSDETQAERFGHLQNKWHDLQWWPFADGGPAGLEQNFLFCAVLSIIVFLYVAELGTKMWDIPSTKFSGWAYKKLKVT